MFVTGKNEENSRSNIDSHIQVDGRGKISLDSRSPRGLADGHMQVVDERMSGKTNATPGRNAPHSPVAETRTGSNNLSRHRVTTAATLSFSAC